jgi:hypothetical protein
MTALPAEEPMTALPASEPMTALPVRPLQPVSAPPPRPAPILDALPAATQPVLDVEPVSALQTLWRLVEDPLGPLVEGELVAAVPPWRWLLRAIGWVFGAVTLVIGLAFLAAIPVVGFLSLGYLLESGGRIARNVAQRDERVRRRDRWWITRFFLSGWLALNDGLVGIRKANRVGALIVGILLMVVPLQLVSSFYASAQIIDPGGQGARFWQIALTVLTIAAAIHLALACLHGGRLRYFFWPIGNLVWLLRRLRGGRFYTEPRDAVWDFVASLRLPYYFWMGLRGYFGALAWLVVPITMMALGRAGTPLAPVLGLEGAILFGVLLLFLPVLQMHFAAENRFRAMFELPTALKRFARAPLAFLLAQFVALLFSLPLYFFKIELIQREVGGIPSLFFVLVSLIFVVFIFPTRLISGWAYARSLRREKRCHWIFSTTGLLAMVPGTAFYVGFVFLTQYTSWKGFVSLYEQHTFLLPVPFQ